MKELPGHQTQQVMSLRGAVLTLLGLHMDFNLPWFSSCITTNLFFHKVGFTLWRWRRHDVAFPSADTGYTLLMSFWKDMSVTLFKTIICYHTRNLALLVETTHAPKMSVMTGLSRRVSVSVSVFKRQQRIERVFYWRGTITFCQRRENVSLLPTAAVQCVFAAGFTTCSVWITPFYYCSYQPAKACLIVLTCSVCFNFNILEFCASIIGCIIIYFLSVLQSKKLSRVSMEPLLGNTGSREFSWMNPVLFQLCSITSAG